jgi:hypothetical protein
MPGIRHKAFFIMALEGLIAGAVMGALVWAMVYIQLTIPF